MLTVTKLSAGHAERYFTTGEESKTACSSWHGKGAISMSLSDPVDPREFSTVLNGLTPQGEPLFQKLKANRVAAFDLTFSAPKSVSIAAVWLGQKDLIQAHRKAVTATLDEIETAAQTRLMDANRKTHYINTRNLAIATFEHLTSRANDPQLHTHAIVMNATQHQNKWRAYYARTVFEAIRKWGKKYRDRLADLVQDLGYKIRTVGRSFWELDNIPDKLIELFSKRRRQILDKVEEGFRGPARTASLITRPPKIFTPVDRLKQKWKQQATALLDKERRHERDR